MIKKCGWCGEPFEAKRATAKFCPAPKTCRLKAARAAGVNPATGEIVTTVDPAAPNGDFSVKTTTRKNKDGSLDVLKQEVVKKPYDRETNLKAFQKMGLDHTSWISTGIPEFDALTQIPRGRLTQIEGREGVGKTTLCLNMIIGLKGHKVLYIDTESSLNPELLAFLEIEAKNFTLYNKSSYLEDIAVIIRAALKEAKYEMIILDSVAMTTTRTREASDITASNIGQKALIMNKLLELTMGDLRRSKTALVFINQTRDSIDPYASSPTYTPGGSGIRFNTSMRISLKTIKSWRFPKAPKNNLYLGHEVEATITKSKVNTPWRKGMFKLHYPQPVEQLEDEIIEEPKRSKRQVIPGAEEF